MNQEVKKILNIIEKNGFEAYIVGGYVRDFLLKRKTNDIDICTNALPKDIQNIFGNSKENGPYGSFNLKTSKYNYDITTYRREFDYKNRHPNKIEYTNNLLEDLNRRDFTINALCMTKKGKIIDFQNGRKDLETKTIKCIGPSESKIKEDPLRILRAIRFACILDFEIEESLWTSIKNSISLLQTLSQARIKQELDCILISPNFQKGLDLLEKLSILSLLGIEYEKINYVNDLCGMWAQLNLKKDFSFTKNEKNQIKIIKKLLNQDLTTQELFQYGLYSVMVTAKIKGIKESEIIKMYKNMPLENRKDLKIKFEEIQKITQKESQEVKKIEEKMINKILKGELKNKKSHLLNYLKKEGA